MGDDGDDREDNEHGDDDDDDDDDDCDDDNDDDDDDDGAWWCMMVHDELPVEPSAVCWGWHATLRRPKRARCLRVLRWSSFGDQMLVVPWQ